MKVLHLTLKAKWYDMIASGEKPEEYRDIKTFWAKRLMNGFPEINGIDKLNPDFKDYSHIRFARGGHFHPTLPQMTIENRGIKIGTGKPQWGAEPGKEYFVIKLGEIISKSDKQ